MMYVKLHFCTRIKTAGSEYQFCEAGDKRAPQNYQEYLNILGRCYGGVEGQGSSKNYVPINFLSSITKQRIIIFNP